MPRACSSDEPRHRHVAAHARAHEHQRAAQVLAEGEQPRDPLLRIVDAAVVHRLDVETLLAGDLGHGSDLAAPWLAVLAVREHHVSFGHALPLTRGHHSAVPRPESRQQFSSWHRPCDIRHMTRPPSARGWRFAIDRGGTFTDIVATDPAGSCTRTRCCRATRRTRRPGRARHRRTAGAPRAGRRARSIRCASAPRSRPTRCSSARASRPCWSSRAACATCCASATSTGPTSSPARSGCRRCCMRTRSRRTSGSRPTARCSSRSTKPRSPGTSQRARATGSAPSPSRSCTPCATPSTSSTRRARARRRLRGDRRLARRGAARRAHRAWRQRRRRRLPVAGAAALPLGFPANSPRRHGARRCC